MQAKLTKLPGPDHPITIEPNPARVTVWLAGRIIADTRKALTLREASYAAVQYIPRKDVDMSLLQRTDHAPYCPIALTTASLLAESVQPMRCGPMRLLTPLLPRSRTTLPSIPIGSTK